MSPDEVRKVVGGVIPPKNTGESTATRNERIEISQMCPFFGAIVKGEEKGVERDGFLSGLSETFVRIWRALTTSGYQSVIAGLELKDLYAADERLRNAGTSMLEAEYPYIEMHVPGKDQFGAGVRAAYGILEFALDMRTDVPDVEEQSLDQTKEEIAGDLMSGIEAEAKMEIAGVAQIPTGHGYATSAPPPADNSKSGQTITEVSPSEIFLFTAAKEPGSGQWLISWPVDGNTVSQLNKMVQMVSSLFGPHTADKIGITTSEERVVCYFTAEDQNG